MAVVQIWDIELTRQLVDAMIGLNQSMKARESMISCQQRIQYSLIHQETAVKLWDDYLAMLSRTSARSGQLQGEEERQAEARALLNIGANIHACVQSLHAIPDILAHALYYSIGLNHTAPARRERDITAKSVAKSLAADASLGELSNQLQTVYKDGEFPYLDALNNNGKHRSLIQARPLARIGVPFEETYTLELLGFEYDDIPYEKRPAIPFLRKEHLRIFRRVMECGNTMNSILAAKTGRQSMLMFASVMEIDD